MMGTDDNSETLSGGETFGSPPPSLSGASDDLDFGQTIKGFVEGQVVFGRYTLRNILGRGGMGVVWQARDRQLEREVALKFLPEMITRDTSAIDELKRETRKCLAITHPHIVRIHDFVEDATSAAIVMEYVDGPTLSGLKVQQSSRIFEPEEILPWLRQLAAALDYAHGQAHIVHRDLKPANLMVNAAGELKVADFGIARSLSDSASRLSVAQHSNTSGTLAYMSPQQATGENPQASDDIYSFGATIYELLTGKPPFFSGNIYGQLQERIPPSILERRTELLGDDSVPVPASWEATIAAALAKDPAARPASAGELTRRLEEPAFAPPTPVVADQAKRIRLAAAAAVAAFLIAFGVWTQREVLFPPGAPPPPPTGLLTLASTPEGATLSLSDGKTLTTPLAAASLPTGSYSGALSKPGYAPAPVEFSIDGGGETALEPVVLNPTTGSLSLTGRTPRGAPDAQYELIPLLLDADSERESAGKSPEATTGTVPAMLNDLPTGLYQAALSANGWPVSREQIRISADKTTDLAWNPAFGSLVLETDPPGVRLSVDGTLIQYAAARTIDLPAGPHEIVAERDGWPAITRTVNVVENSVRTETFVFAPARITLNSSPSGATVTRGQEVLGKTPLTVEKLPPGSYTFSLTISGYKPETLTAEAAAGGQTVLSAELSEIPKPKPSATLRKSTSSGGSSAKKPAASSSSSDPVRRGIENQYRRGQITREEYLNAIKNL